MTHKKIPIIIASIALFSFSNSTLLNVEKPKEFTVVLDPGHGGTDNPPLSQNGDRYDPLSKKYLSTFRAGAVHMNLKESELMYSIASKSNEILKLTQSKDGFKKFRHILSKYGIKPVGHSIIFSHLSRPETLKDSDAEILKDPNGPYRLFDYPLNGTITGGRITAINKLKPQLVISLHCDYSPPPHHQGFTAIIVPPFRYFKKGIEYYNNKNSDDFYKTMPDAADYWLVKDRNTDSFESFVNDVALYFTSYQLKLPHFEQNPDDFKGFKQNMVQWSYSDFPSWKKEVILNKGAYSKNLENFSPDTRFWKREMSIYENFKRDGGEEGFGGDNYFATMEIIRFMLASLELRGMKNYVYAKDPYYSCWLNPILLNAINAYIEIGYLTSYKFRKILTEETDALAEAVAVASYSLLAETENIEDMNFANKPKFKNIDLNKYIINNKSYFDLVSK
ncbi:MAG: N-acetylmuramoyl-L-alanine amidase [Spirochaetes bacterium]|nr:N-acetylmuramoyl-L-alanine amidase [Spirochaetota bacterium]